MKKMLAMLMLLCVLVMPFSAMAEADAEIPGDVYVLEDLGLEIWIPEGLDFLEVSDKDAENGVLYTLTDDEKTCAMVVVALKIEGKTMEQLVAEATEDGMTEIDVVEINGIPAIAYKAEAENMGCVALVDVENGVMVVFSFTPFDTEEAQALFALIMSSVTPAEN